MQAGQVLKVVSYRNKETTIQYGTVETVRDIHTDGIKDKTFRKYTITRSRYLLTLKDKAGNYRSYYEKFLDYRPVPFLQRCWLKIMGKI